MAKRVNLLTGIDMSTAEKQAAAPPTNMTEQPQSARPDKKVVKSTIYLSPVVHYKLKEIALAKGCKVHDLFIEGIDKTLLENGFPSSAELDK